MQQTRGEIGSTLSTRLRDKYGNNVDVPEEKGKWRRSVFASSLEVCQIVRELTLAQLTPPLDLSRVPLLFSARLFGPQACPNSSAFPKPSSDNRKGATTNTLPQTLIPRLCENENMKEVLSIIHSDEVIAKEIH